jgi:hypothetical protein
MDDLIDYYQTLIREQKINEGLLDFERVKGNLLRTPE